MWCGLYANELALRLLPRDLEEPEVFLAYAELLPRLREAERQGAALRRFEWTLLSALGVAPEIDVVGETRIFAYVDPETAYLASTLIEGTEPASWDVRSAPCRRSMCTAGAGCRARIAVP